MCVSTRGSVGEAGPLWCCHSPLCTCHTGSFPCKLFLEPINKNLGELVCLVSKIVAMVCSGISTEKLFEIWAWGNKDVFVRPVIIKEGTFLSLHFEFRHSQGCVERPWLKKAEKERRADVTVDDGDGSPARFLTHPCLGAWGTEFTQRIQSETLPQKLGREKESQF